MTALAGQQAAAREAPSQSEERRPLEVFPVASARPLRALGSSSLARGAGAEGPGGVSLLSLWSQTRPSGCEQPDWRHLTLT